MALTSCSMFLISIPAIIFTARMNSSRNLNTGFPVFIAVFSILWVVVLMIVAARLNKLEIIKNLEYDLRVKKGDLTKVELITAQINEVVVGNDYEKYVASHYLNDFAEKYKNHADVINVNESGNLQIILKVILNNLNDILKTQDDSTKHVAFELVKKAIEETAGVIKENMQEGPTSETLDDNGMPIINTKPNIQIAFNSINFVKGKPVLTNSFGG